MQTPRRIAERVGGAAGRRGALGGLAHSPTPGARLPDYLGNHVLVSVTALALGLALSFPLALASLRRPRLRALLLAATSIVQTVPGLALLALFYPRAAGCRSADGALLGVGFSALGFLPAVLALALYSMLPVVRNTITGIDGIDPAIKQAAQGVGMTERQSLTHGGAAAGAAGDHGRRAHRRRVGDRHRHAVHADRPDQPRQLHLHRPADAELDLRAVRLRRRRGAGAGGRPAAGPDRARLHDAAPQSHGGRAASGSR